MGELIGSLDLGQQRDFTAWIILDKLQVSGQTEYHVRHLERFHLGTSYADIARTIKERYSVAPLAGCPLVVDQTGVGRPVVDMLYAIEIDATIYPFTITGGHAVTQADDGYHVPKQHLVSALQLPMQTGRFKISKGLPLAGILMKELANFRVKITKSANEVYECWREGENDDCCLAACMGVWAGENLFTGGWDTTPNPAARSLMSGAPDQW